MFVERLESPIRLDEDDIALIVKACNILGKSESVSVDELWPGEVYDFTS